MPRRRSISLAAGASLVLAWAPLGAHAQSQPQPQSTLQPAAAALPSLPPAPVLPTVPNLGRELSAPVTSPPNADLVGVQQQPFVGITLQNAIGMALQRNTDIALSQANRRIAYYQIIAAKGAYDVNFQIVPSYSHSVSPVVTAFSSNATGGPVTQDTANVTAGFRGITQSGGSYNVGVVGTRITSNNAFNSYNPYYETALQFAVTQPLGKNASLDQPRLQVQLSQINSALASSNLLLQASNTIVQVQDAYYDLVYAWQNVAIQEQGLQQATAQAQSNARLAARGVVAPTDVVEAQTQVSVFQDNVFAAIQNVQRVQNQLKTLILANPGDPVWLANLVPTTPIAQAPAQPTLSDLISTAIANRPEIAQVRAQREQADVNLAFARNQIKPQVDLGLGYTSNGFAGNPINPNANPLFALLGPVLPPGALSAFSTPAYQTGGLGTAWSNLFSNRFPTYNAQLTVSFPLGNHTAKADYAIAQQQEQNASINETAVLQRIRSEAVNAIQGLREAQSRVTAARAAREAAERVLLGEERRFQAGTSTTFLVLQRQLELANDRGRELQAQTDLDKAIVELQRVSGGIFQQNNVDVNQLGFTTLNEASTKSVIPPVATPAPASSAPAVRRSPR